MKLKVATIEGKEYAEVQDGKPIFIADDGKEIPFDAPGTVNTISRLNAEAKRNRERYETAEEKLEPFKDIEDAEAAKRALRTVQNLSDKKLVDAGEVDKVKAEAIKAVEDKYAPVVAELSQLKGELHEEKIGGSFARSPFIKEKIAIPVDMVKARFGNNFEIKDGKIVAYDSAKNPIFSRSKPGEHAEFDEALEILVDQYPEREQILKGTGANGTGSGPSDTSAHKKVVPGNLAGDVTARRAGIGAMFPNLPEK